MKRTEGGGNSVKIGNESNVYCRWGWEAIHEISFERRYCIIPFIINDVN